MDDLSKMYPNSKVTDYLMKNAIIHRKTISLSGSKFRTYPKPKLEKANFFNKKKVLKHNEELMADYDDFIAAQQRFIKIIGIKKWEKISRQLIKDEKEMSDVLWDMVNADSE